MKHLSSSRSQTVRNLWRDRYLYLLLLPVIVYYIVFKYAPLYGLSIAFKDYRFADGIWGSAWAGMKYFESLFNSREFFLVVRNTLLLNLYSILFAFPVPIILSILLNEIKSTWYKRGIQQMIYVPHFLSWVVMGGMIITILSPKAGIVNKILQLFTGDTIFFMSSNFWWPIVFVFSTVWKESGWGTIIYLAAIAGISPELYEAAIIDGASKFRQVWHITLPSITPTIVIMLVLRMGSVMDVGFEQVNILQNATVRDVSDVISTFVYRMGIEQAQYSLTTAMGIFQSLISVILLLLANNTAKKLTDNGIW